MHKTSTSAPHSKQRRTAVTRAAFSALGLGVATISYVGLPTANAAPLPVGCTNVGTAVTCTYAADTAFVVPGPGITSITVAAQGDSGEAATGALGGA
ncbi:hypothetical protein, partial [Sporichthya sp.]|uniref:hypothetical protein n=1 Tax=Sporichthya sp. TaxID=65475 RepID=UPI0017A053FC